MVKVSVEGNRTIIPFADGNMSFLRLKSAMDNLARKDFPKETLDALKTAIGANVRGLFQEAYLFRDFFKLCPLKKGGGIFYREDVNTVDVYPETYQVGKPKHTLASPRLNLRLEGKENKELSILLAFSTGPISEWPVFRDLLQINSSLTGRYQISSDLANPESSKITLYVTPLTEGAYFLESAKTIYGKWGFDGLNNSELNDLRTDDFRDRDVNSAARGKYAKTLLKMLGVKLE